MRIIRGLIVLMSCGAACAGDPCEDWAPGGYCCTRSSKTDSENFIGYECVKEISNDSTTVARSRIDSHHSNIVCLSSANDSDFKLKDEETYTFYFQNCSTLMNQSKTIDQFKSEQKVLKLSVKNANVSKELLQNLSAVVSLEILIGKNSHVHFDAFRGLLELRHLTIASNDEPGEGETDAARNTPNLIKLHWEMFYRNMLTGVIFKNLRGLTFLPQYLLSRQRNLNSFTLTYSSVKTIPTIFFAYNRNMANLNLSHNKLEQLTEGIFANLTNLQTLDLSGNNLVTIHPNAFNPYCKLTFVDLSWNKLTFDEFESMSPLATAKNITHLNLSHNGLRKIFQDWRDVMAYLKVLDLSFNNFTKLEANDVLFSQIHVLVNLEYNNIEKIDLKYSESNNGSNKGNATILLQNNHIRCDEKAEPFKKFLRYLNGQLFIDANGEFIHIDSKNLTCIGLEDGKIVDMNALSRNVSVQEPLLFGPFIQRKNVIRHGK